MAASFTRRGSILTWFAVFLFAALPFMALLVHLGMVTLTWRQMQTAVNTAAIEGLRFRDELSDADRRVQVQELVSALFDDDLDSSNGDTMQFGAGPDIEFDSNSGIALPDADFQASPLITNVGVWKPDPRLNTGDELHGDMVAGDYVYSVSDPDHDSHAESSTCSREDFEAQPGGDAFLVRLRRTRPSNGTAPPLDDVPDVSSTGPTVPFLFGRGPYVGSEFLNQRERGTIVRASAIAQERPVATVGVPRPDENLDEGLALFDIQRASWDGPLTSTTVTFDASGSFNSGVSGRFIVRAVTTLGDATSPLMSTLAVSDIELGEDRIVPIADSINGTDRVVGFGLVRLTGGGGTYTLERLPEAIVARNASSPFTKPVTVTGTDFNDVWDAFQALSGRALAPALVRTVE